jgi:hypothetical protein
VLSFTFAASANPLVPAGGFLTSEWPTRRDSSQKQGAQAILHAAICPVHPPSTKSSAGRWLWPTLSTPSAPYPQLHLIFSRPRRVRLTPASGRSAVAEPCPILKGLCWDCSATATLG